jgi:hypothetical protein
MLDRFVVGGFYRVHDRARRGREPQRTGHALRAAGVSRPAARCRTPDPGRARRRRPGPVLRLRGDRPPGTARRRRARSRR